MDVIMVDSVQWRETNPGTSEHMPLVNLEQVSEFLDVLDKIPGRILIRVCSPKKNKYRCHLELIHTHGVDFPAPL
jgi:hypothetical protein